MRNKMIFTDIALVLLSSAILLTSCTGNSGEGMIIITESVSSQGKPDFVTGESWRYLPQTRL